jgi:hypothetical protein
VHSTDLNSDGSPLSPEVKNEIQKILKNRDVDLAHQIAFLENGLSLYRNEDALIREYEISKEVLEDCKVRLRNEIETFKEKHRYGKYRLVQETAGRLDLYQELRKAAIVGDEAKVALIAKAIEILDKSAPIAKLEALNDILKNVSDPETSQTQTNTIIFNQQVNGAREILADRKKRMLDITPKIE